MIYYISLLSLISADRKEMFSSNEGFVTILGKTQVIMNHLYKLFESKLYKGYGGDMEERFGFKKLLE